MWQNFIQASVLKSGNSANAHQKVKLFYFGCLLCSTGKAMKDSAQATILCCSYQFKGFIKRVAGMENNWQVMFFCQFELYFQGFLLLRKKGFIPVQVYTTLSYCCKL